MQKKTTDIDAKHTSATEEVKESILDLISKQNRFNNLTTENFGKQEKSNSKTSGKVLSI